MGIAWSPGWGARRTVRVLYRAIDVVVADIDRFHVQARLGDQAVAYVKDDHAAHGKRRAVRVLATPIPLAPLHTPVNRGRDKLRREIRNSLKHRPPVRQHLNSTAEGSARVHRLGTLIAI